MNVNEVVVVTRNSEKHIGAFVDSVVRSGSSLIVVDNGSTDGTLGVIRTHCPRARIIATGENLGYGKAMNLGFQETTGQFVVLSNPDVVFLDHSIARMLKFLDENPTVAVVGPQQMFPDRSWQRSYGELPGVWSGIKDACGITTLKNVMRRSLWPRRFDSKEKDVPYVDGAVLAVRREAFLEMGGFDESFYFYSDESDLCARLRKAGWRVTFLPAAEVIHVRGADSMKVDRSERFVRYMVQSQALLASKHLPGWKAAIYSRLQVWQFARLGALHRIVRRLTQNKSATDYKVWLADTYASIWKEFVRCPRLAFAPFGETRSSSVNQKSN